jgi:4-alpha-glucanotransferase
MSDDEAVRDLARSAGITVDWTNAAGDPQVVTPEVLRRILGALGFPSGTSQQVTESREQARNQTAASAHAPLLTATVGEPISLIDTEALASVKAALILENGERQDVRLERTGRSLMIGGIPEPGYYTLHIGDRVVTIAVAPRKCFTPEDVIDRPRLWGMAVQLYGLRHPGDCGIGDTAGLSEFAQNAATYGADAIALSPTHALFGADLSRYGPYSPSNRLFLNPLHANPGTLFGNDHVSAMAAKLGLADQFESFEGADVIDWQKSASAKLALFRGLFDELWKECQGGNPGQLGQDFAAFRERGGDLIEQHAQFEVLQTFRLAADANGGDWRQWPRAWQHSRSAEVSAFAAAHSGEIAFHAFLQWIADRSLATAQGHARACGMKIGLIADVAIGMDAGGSHAWSRQEDLVVGLNVGAPPDLLNPLGQDWGLTAFSPQALLARGYAPFVATLRAVMRNAGGVRIDHAMGLTRLWLVPEGAAPAEGAYLNYPLGDLLRLIKLESLRHRALVIGEDLGTVPGGFQEALADAGVAGMRVLWFERDGDKFRPPNVWPRHAVALTSTHDLPTVAGWWRGTDIDTRESLGQFDERGVKKERAKRAHDRKLLQDSFRSAGIVGGSDTLINPDEAVDAAIRFVADTPAQLVLVPLEDMLGLVDQPNLPGTVFEHPNWCRRYPGQTSSIFEKPEVQRRARSLRRRAGG